MTQGLAEQSSVSDEASHSPWECLATAIGFLTRIPVPGGRDRSPAEYAQLLREAVVYFPLVGGLIGLFTAAALLVSLSFGASPMLAALIALGMEAMLTGALHEDALADTCDALGGGWTRDRIIEIMKCSQLGSYGVIALVVGVGARAAAMAAIGEHSAIWALVSIAAAAAVGRMAILCMMATTQPIPESSATTKAIAAAQNARRLLIAISIGSPFWIGWLAIHTTVACASLALALAVLYWFRRKVLETLHGITGDLLGCSAFITQLIILIGASLK